MASVQELHNFQTPVHKTNGLKPSPDMESDKFTFILPHKHFNLEANEVFWIDRMGDDYKIKVVDSKGLSEDAAPCMWIYGNTWLPLAYTRMKDGRIEAPDVPKKSCNIGMRWLNNGGLESTDVHARTMHVVHGDNSDEVNALTTMVNWEDGKVGCSLKCGPVHHQC